MKGRTQLRAAKIGVLEDLMGMSRVAKYVFQVTSPWMQIEKIVATIMREYFWSSTKLKAWLLESIVGTGDDVLGGTNVYSFGLVQAYFRRRGSRSNSSIRCRSCFSICVAWSLANCSFCVRMALWDLKWENGKFEVGLYANVMRAWKVCLILLLWTLYIQPTTSPSLSITLSLNFLYDYVLVKFFYSSCCYYSYYKKYISKGLDCESILYLFTEIVAINSG